MKQRYRTFSSGLILVLLMGFGAPIASPVGGDISRASQLYHSEQALERWGDQSSPVLTANILDVPIIAQNPELPKGCEVTSLAMLLQFAGIKVDKLTLADQIQKVPFFQGNVYGNPNQGFVGDMYNKAKEGYGVYHQPIAKLAEKYFPNQIADLTGKSFADTLTYINQGNPVWVIVNTTFHPLQDDMFVDWNTEAGHLQITYLEHAVVVTGYDQESVYINDPISGEKNKKLGRDAFQKAWEQMGSQAVSIKH